MGAGEGMGLEIWGLKGGDRDWRLWFTLLWKLWLKLLEDGGRMLWSYYFGGVGGGFRYGLCRS